MNIRLQNGEAHHSGDTRTMAESNEPRTIMIPLSGAAAEVLRQLFFNGPTWDGNLIAKTGRDELCRHGYATRHEGWQQLTHSGLQLCITNGLDREKEARERVRSDEMNGLRKLRDQIALARGQWIERWEGSGLTRGSYIHAKNVHGHHGEVIAYFGDGDRVHDAVSDIVMLHNAAIELP